MNTNKPNPNQSNQDRSREGESRQDETWKDETWKDETWKDETWTGAEAGLEQVLRNFRSSVHAWSDAELSRPRVMTLPAHRHGWRFAAAWALGCVVAVGSLTAGLYQHHRSELQASNTHQLQVQLQFQAPQAAVSEQAGQRDENLMAAVDSDVSRPVPSAMEPLAQLMDDNGDQ